jgi:hypothetical protein
MRRSLVYLFVLGYFLLSTQLFAQNLSEIPLTEEGYLLVNAYLDKGNISQSVDVYVVDEQILISIEQLFEALKLRYQLRLDELHVWKDEEEYSFVFLTDTLKPALAEGSFFWGYDGYYQFIDIRALEKLFGSDLSLDKRKLHLNIITPAAAAYNFPITIIAQQNAQRLKNRVYKDGASLSSKVDTPIDIPDQYRIFTLPHGEIFTKFDLDNSEQKGVISAQLAGDFLYHSAKINVNKTSDNQLVGGLSLSRYKTTPNARIFGLFDQYSVGDIGSYNSSVLSNSGSGLGVNFFRGPENFRRENTKITLQQNAPAGFEAELFRNNRFVESTTVPDTGLLVFTDVDIYYGSNDFQIKVYGPFGEEDVFLRSYPLASNALAGGDKAYGVYLFDPNRTVFNNAQNAGDPQFNNYGVTFDYGVNDFWQIGGALSNNVNANAEAFNQGQLLSIKNNLNLPGMLFENEIAINQDTNYRQISNLSGRAFSSGSYQLSYETANTPAPVSQATGESTAQGSNFSSLSLSYFDNVGGLSYSFRAGHNKQGDTTFRNVNNTLFYNWDKLRLNHSLTYNSFKRVNGLASVDSDNVRGRLGIAGDLFGTLRVSANLAYDPERSDPILNSSSLTAQWSLTDPFQLSHYFTLNYQPLTTSNLHWRLSHNLSYETNNYRLSLNTSYKENNEWSFGLFFNFYLGYDYLNNRTVTSSKFTSHSATLNIHSYLDRHLNGVPDVLDYDLEGVEFTGNPDWQGLRSGEKGRIILPGVPANQPFKFKATWKSGANTINSDYNIYTHPGARVDVNMPFYLNNELAGFIFRETAKGQIPVTNLSIELLGQNNEVVQHTRSDRDGYYEFINIRPSSYQIKINKDSLSQKTLTGDIIGYDIITPRVGGFAELPAIKLRQQKTDSDYGNELTVVLALPDEDQEPLVWNDDEAVRANYFSLPTKSKIKAKYSLGQPVIAQRSRTATSFVSPANPQVNHDGKLAKTPDVNIPVIKDTEDLTDSGYYTLQLGAFSAQNTAISYAAKATTLMYKATIFTRENKYRKISYHVFTGQFTDALNANNYAAKVGLEKGQFILQSLKKSELDLDMKVTEMADRPDVNIDNDALSNANPKPATADSNATAEQTWVIQFYASRSPIEAKYAQAYSPAGIIYSAQKMLVDTDELWYCLVSAKYLSKEAATAVAKLANLGGWVIASSSFTNMTPIQ